MDKSVTLNTKYEIIDTFVWDGQVYLKIQETHKGTSGYRWTRYNYMENKAEDVKKHRGYT